MTKGGANPGSSVGIQVYWHAAGDFLNAGQYEQAAEILHQAQVASEQTGDAMLADTLAAACQICLACSQCRTQEDWHRRACEEANQREHELRQQLQAILKLVTQYGASESRKQRITPPSAAKFGLPRRDIPESVGGPGLWQRIKSLLGLGVTTQLAEGEASTKTTHPPPLPSLEPGEQQEQAPPSLTVYCLGLFRAYNNEHLVEKWPGHKCKSIFKYMIIHREHPIHIEILMDLFWRDVDPEAARRNLYQAVYSLRQALQTGDPGFPYILCEDGCYYLNPDVRLWVDSDDFTAHYQTGQRLERESRLQEAIREYELADNLYEGEFMAEDRYEDWSLVPRENLKHAHLDVLDRLSQHYFGRAQFAMCIAFCQKILAEDNCREDAHRRLMRCHLHQGQRHLALRQYHMCVEALKRELDVPPMPATVELYQEIQRNRAQFPDI
jgi:DNA-binding SARP family transcriptional activator